MEDYTNRSYRFATDSDFDKIMQGRLEILFIEEKEKKFITSKIVKEETEKISSGIKNNSIIVIKKSESDISYYQALAR